MLANTTFNENRRKYLPDAGFSPIFVLTLTPILVTKKYEKHIRANHPLAPSSRKGNLDMYDRRGTPRSPAGLPVRLIRHSTLLKAQGG